DWASALADIAASVTLIFRSDEMRGHEAMVEGLYKKEITIKPGKCIDRLIANEQENAIEYVILDDGSHVAVDDVLVSHGYDSNCGFLEAMESDFDFNEHQMRKKNNLGDPTV